MIDSSPRTYTTWAWITLLLGLALVPPLSGCSSQALECATDNDCFLGEVCASGSCSSTPQSIDRPDMPNVDMSSSQVDQSSLKPDLVSVTCECDGGKVCDPADPGRCISPTECGEDNLCKDPDLVCVDGQCVANTQGEVKGEFRPDPLAVILGSDLEFSVQSDDGKPLFGLRFFVSGQFSTQGSPSLIDLAVVSNATGQATSPKEWTQIWGDETSQKGDLFGSCDSAGGLTISSNDQRVESEVFRAKLTQPGQVDYTIKYELRCQTTEEVLQAWQSNMPQVQELFYKAFVNILTRYNTRAVLQQNGENVFTSKTTFSFE